LKIAVLGTKGIPGRHGVEVVVDSLAPHFVSLGHDVTVYGYDSYTVSQNDYQGIKIKALPGSSRKNLEMISHMFTSSMDTRSDCFDIVHIHSADPCLLAWLPKSKYGVVATSHGQAYIRKKWGVVANFISKIAERFFIYSPDIITSVSKPLADYYESKYRKKVLYIPNGITFREKPSSKYLDKWDIRPQNFLFCSAGRVERTKGLHTLIEAYQTLKTGLPLVIAGGGSGTDPHYLDELKRSAPSEVKFVGFLTGDEFFSLYAYARVFVFPSEYEAMSMALLEGLSFGTPTVYSNIPENKAVAEGVGYPFEVSDADSLAKTLDDVLLNYDKAIEIGQMAKKVVREKHDWGSIAKQYNDVYMKLATG
jgi:glycosyltransferase involved in cell wall biosynthesis